MTVTVTATLDEAGVAWPGTLPAGWVETSATTATFDVKLAGVRCTPVAPADPDVTGATCAAGEVSPPSIGLPTTEGVTYVLAPVRLGDGTAPVEVRVTATLADGYEWGTIGGDWQRVDATTATLELTLPAAGCDEVTPVAPSLHQAECAGGVVTVPTLTLMETQGITYAVDAKPRTDRDRPWS